MITDKTQNDASFVHKNDRPWPNRRLKRAAIVGHTTESSSRVWFRTGQPGDFSMLHFAESDGNAAGWFKENKHSIPFSLDKMPKGIRHHKFSVDWKTDTTAVVDVDNLPAGEVRHYALYSHGDGRIVLGHDKTHAFKTPSDDGGDFRFGLLSCHMPYSVGRFSQDTEVANMDMWHLMASAIKAKGAKSRPDFLIAGGDQCYTDGVKTLNIWTHLQKVMRKDGDGNLLPDVDTMKSWYRDIYRGYWGFAPVRHLFSSIPTYMIWDDHELADGWGSHYFDGNTDGRDDEMNEILPDLEKRELSREDGMELLRRMGEAGKAVYYEYEHQHNPPTPDRQYDYAFDHKSCAFYVLDGRGYRDVNRAENRILGAEQMARFEEYVNGLNEGKTKFLFVVSAVPVMHWKPSVVNKEDSFFADIADLQDDLRDSWEWEKHDKERGRLMDILFGAADKGIRVAILSGDVHLSAAFAIRKDGKTIYQLTSSAITYNVGRMSGWAAGFGIPDEGETDDGYCFEREALYAEPSYAVIRVLPQEKRAVFQIYGRQSVRPPENLKQGKKQPEEKAEKPLYHSIAKIPLWCGK